MVSFHSYIVKFMLALDLQFSKPQMNHILSFVHGMILCDGRITVSAILRSTNAYRDLSCMTRFLNEAPWNPNRMKRRRMNCMMKRIKKARAKKSATRPIVFLIVNDSQIKKDRSTKKMEGLSFNYSHADGKTVWSHCLVTSHLVSENYSIAWDVRPYYHEAYCKEQRLPFKSKNDLAIEMVEDYRSPTDEQVYVLVDSWYTSKKLIDTCQDKGFELIGAFRMNRKFYPENHENKGIKNSEFASIGVPQKDLRSVTVKGHEYQIYPYEGPLSDIERVKVLLTWEGEAKGEPSLCLLSTDTCLDFVTIQQYYGVRWNIETGYRYFKQQLGFDQYQLLSLRGIERFWEIQFLTYNILEDLRVEWSTSCWTFTMGDVMRRIQKDHLGQVVMYAYEKGLAQKPVVQLLKELKLEEAA